MTGEGHPTSRIRRPVGDFNAVVSASSMADRHLAVRECWPSTTSREEELHKEFCSACGLSSSVPLGTGVWAFFPSYADLKRNQGIKNLDDILVPADDQRKNLWKRLEVRRAGRYDHMALVL